MGNQLLSPLLCYSLVTHVIADSTLLSVLDTSIGHDVDLEQHKHEDSDTPPVDQAVSPRVFTGIRFLVQLSFWTLIRSVPTATDARRNAAPLYHARTA